MGRSFKNSKIRGERCYEITAITRVLISTGLAHPEVTVLAMRCAAAAKTARGKYLRRLLKKGKPDYVKPQIWRPQAVEEGD